MAVDRSPQLLRVRSAGVTAATGAEAQLPLTLSLPATPLDPSALPSAPATLSPGAALVVVAAAGKH